MLRSMYSAISGLKNFQTKLDVIGNNISNVSTYGFKKGRVTFQDLVSQQMAGASSPTITRGGINPMQVGLGANMASIDTISTQGSLQTTGRSLDLAVSGDGYFVASDGLEQMFTRAGNFYLDSEGNVVNSQGLKLMGYGVDKNGVVDPSRLQGLHINDDSIRQPTTDSVTLTGNLIPSDYMEPMTLNDISSKSKTFNYTVNDGANDHDASITLTPTKLDTTDPNKKYISEASYEISSPDATNGPTTGTVLFNSDGTVNKVLDNNGNQVTNISANFNFGSTNATSNVDLTKLTLDGTTTDSAAVNTTSSTVQLKGNVQPTDFLESAVFNQMNLPAKTFNLQIPDTDANGNSITHDVTVTLTPSQLDIDPTDVSSGKNVNIMSYAISSDDLSSPLTGTVQFNPVDKTTGKPILNSNQPLTSVSFTNGTTAHDFSTVFDGVTLTSDATSDTPTDVAPDTSNNLVGNLNVHDVIGFMPADHPSDTAEKTVGFKIFDVNGDQHNATVSLSASKLTNVDPMDPSKGQYVSEMTFNIASPDDTTGPHTGKISFKQDGTVDRVTVDGDSNMNFTFGAGNTVNLNNLDFNTLTLSDKMPDTADVVGDVASLDSFSIGSSGEIYGVLSDGSVQLLGEIALSQFNNPDGLTKAGGSMFKKSSNSGDPVIGTAADGGATIQSGALEMSNVDLSEEFTGMIEAQRGYQANARVITTADQILQELVNLKR